MYIGKPLDSCTLKHTRDELKVLLRSNSNSLNASGDIFTILNERSLLNSNPDFYVNVNPDNIQDKTNDKTSKQNNTSILGGCRTIVIINTDRNKDK